MSLTSEDEPSLADEIEDRVDEACTGDLADADEIEDAFLSS
jgi:hypothetical protein